MRVSCVSFGPDLPRTFPAISDRRCAAPAGTGYGRGRVVRVSSHGNFDRCGSGAAASAGHRGGRWTGFCNAAATSTPGRRSMPGSSSTGRRWRSPTLASAHPPAVEKLLVTALGSCEADADWRSGIAGTTILQMGLRHEQRRYEYGIAGSRRDGRNHPQVNRLEGSPRLVRLAPPKTDGGSGSP
jgi:hypothetical protein